MVVNFKKLGANIHNARLSLKIPQKKVAKDLSTKKSIFEQSTVSRIESGKYTGRFLVIYIHYLVQKAKEANKKTDVNYETIFEGSIPSHEPLAK